VIALKNEIAKKIIAKFMQIRIFLPNAAYSLMLP
jgi:hypothetical protein